MFAHYHVWASPIITCVYGYYSYPSNINRIVHSNSKLVQRNERLSPFNDVAPFGHNFVSDTNKTGICYCPEFYVLGAGKRVHAAPTRKPKRQQYDWLLYAVCGVYNVGCVVRLVIVLLLLLRWGWHSFVLTLSMLLRHETESHVARPTRVVYRAVTVTIMTHSRIANLLLFIAWPIYAFCETLCCV